MTTPHELSATLGRHFSVERGRSAGLTERRLRADDLAAPFYGVRTAIAPGSVIAESEPGGPTLEELDALVRVHAYATRMAADVFFTHTSAALIWRLPLPPVFDADVHVAKLHPGRGPRGRHVRGHELMSHLVTVWTHHGLRVSSPASTWVQLGSMLSVRDLVAIGDAIVRVPRSPDGRPGPIDGRLASVEQLRFALDAGARSGAGRLRAALDLVKPGSASRPETFLRLDLADAGLPEPELDVEIFDAYGGFIGITELAYPEWKVLIEYEGDHHRTSRQQWNRDIEKYERARAAGWTVVQITAEHLFSWRREAVTRVRAALIAAGWTPHA